MWKVSPRNMNYFDQITQGQNNIFIFDQLYEEQMIHKEAFKKIVINPNTVNKKSFHNTIYF